MGPWGKGCCKRTRLAFLHADILSYHVTSPLFPTSAMMSLPLCDAVSTMLFGTLASKIVDLTNLLSLHISQPQVFCYSNGK